MKTKHIIAFLFAFNIAAVGQIGDIELMHENYSIVMFAVTFSIFYLLSLKFYKK